LTYSEYTITGRRVQALRRVYSLTEQRFEDATTFEIELAT